MKSVLRSELRITEIFYSLQGETRTVGIPTVFIRLTGCPLRCQYCDTSYAFKGGQTMSFSEIFQKVESYSCKVITVTGGEPLAQKACFSLLSTLCDLDYQVSLETGGAIDVSQVDSRVVKVLDLKTPESGEKDKNLLSNIKHLNKEDQVKFVICNEQDYEWSKSMLHEYQLNKKCEVLFSPSYHQLAGHQLADWILRDKLPVRFQIQLHKHLWGDMPGK